MLDESDGALTCICKHTGLPTAHCECWNFDPDSPEARFPDAAVFLGYVEAAKIRVAAGDLRPAWAVAA